MCSSCVGGNHSGKSSHTWPQLAKFAMTYGEDSVGQWKAVMKLATAVPLCLFCFVVVEETKIILFCIHLAIY